MEMIAFQSRRCDGRPQNRLVRGRVARPHSPEAGQLSEGRKCSQQRGYRRERFATVDEMKFERVERSIGVLSCAG